MAVTDAAGRFRIAGLFPGFEYAVVIDGVQRDRFDLAPDATGERAVGDIRRPSMDR
jgi:hypothetical protein